MGKGFNYRKYIWVIPWIFVGMVFISLQVAIYSQDKHRVVLKTPVNPPPTVSKIDLSDTMVFYINTDSLDNDSNILDWFFDNGKLCVYTKQDSINDEIERYNYIRSLDPEFGE